MKAPAPRPCPVCGGLERRLVCTQSFLDGSLGGGYDVVVCSDCGAGFADGIPPQGEMDRYYAEQSKYTYSHADGAESPWDAGRFEATVEQVLPHLGSREARILDIGCATGGLLAAFKRRGYPNVTGADPSPACAAAAMRLYGIGVRASTLGAMRDWDERFDLILLVGVLEHVREAADAVRTAARLLAPGGLLYCAVPDVEGFVDCSGGPYQQFSTEHVNFFSTVSRDRLFGACGLAPVQSWRWSVEWRESVREPIASGLYGHGAAHGPAFDAVTGPSLDRYAALSRDADLPIHSAIEALRVSQEPIVVWGAGTLARRLLATTRFTEANIRAFVDSNPHLRGLTLAGRPIVPTDAIAGWPEAILVCSVTFEFEIAEAIRGRGYPNRILSISSREFP